MREMFPRNSRRALLALLLMLPTAGPLLAGEQGYDEIFDAQGEVREQYREVWKTFEKLPQKAKKDFIKNSLQDFKGDNKLNPLPRILTQSEYSELEQGVIQRGTALRMFLEDHYSGRKSYLDTVIPKDVMTRILNRSSDAEWEKFIDPHQIAFPYGPDIIRDKAGIWRVLEDNTGFIGGPGDLELARTTLFKRMPSYKNILHPIDDPAAYYGDLFATIRKAVPKGEIVMLQVPPYPDNEDNRLRSIYTREGAIVTTPNGRMQLKINGKGVYLYDSKNPQASQKKVGFLILNAEHHHLDLEHPGAYRRYLMEESQHILDELADSEFKEDFVDALTPNPKDGKVDLKKVLRVVKGTPYEQRLSPEYRTEFPGLLEAIKKGLVKTNYTPGVDFVGDKEFNIYVEDLIRYYLDEEPILKNVPTRKFAQFDGSLDKNLLEEVFRNQAQYVIKSVDGRGGDAVWVGDKISQAEFLKAKERIEKEPWRYIVQEYTPLSEHNKYITDLRMISYVHPRGVLASQTPWGRTLPIEGDGKVNLSTHGMESAIVIVEDPPTVSRKKRAPRTLAPCRTALGQAAPL